MHCWSSGVNLKDSCLPELNKINKITYILLTIQTPTTCLSPKWLKKWPNMENSEQPMRSGSMHARGPLLLLFTFRDLCFPWMCCIWFSLCSHQVLDMFIMVLQYLCSAICSQWDTHTLSHIFCLKFFSCNPYKQGKANQNKCFGSRLLNKDNFQAALLLPP